MSGEREGLIEHHTHYKEIDGYDETVWMTPSEHRLLHNRLRREGKCNIPAEELRVIACKANSRTEKVREYSKQWHKNNPGYMIKYLEDTAADRQIKWKQYYIDNGERIKDYQNEYRKNNQEKIKERNRKYREKNKEKIRAAKKKCYEANKKRK